MELEALEEVYSDIRALGAQLVAITPELERYTRLVHRKSNLSFDILSDPHLKTAEQFGLVYVLPDYLRELYKSFGSTLDKFNDEPEYRLPMPARYIIDTGGIIRVADVNADYTIRPEPSETVRKLAELKRGG
jgi:peroxiredoxin